MLSNQMHHFQFKSTKIIPDFGMEMVKKSTVYNLKGIQIHGKGHTQ